MSFSDNGGHHKEDQNNNYCTGEKCKQSTDALCPKCEKYSEYYLNLKYCNNCGHCGSRFAEKHIKKMSAQERMLLYKSPPTIITIVNEHSLSNLYFNKTGPCYYANDNNANILLYESNKSAPCTPKTQVNCFTPNVSHEELDTKTGQTNSKTSLLGVKYRCGPNEQMEPIHMIGSRDRAGESSISESVSASGDILLIICLVLGIAILKQ